MPENWITLMKPGTVRIEIYFFPAAEEKGVARFATAGLSANHLSSGQARGTEWMMAMPGDLGGETLERIFAYLCELIAHHLEAAPDSPIPRMMDESRLTPACWPPHALLRGKQMAESEELEEIQIGDEVIRILWWYHSRGMRFH
ncbi:hypothetical protein NST04_04250 [Paenibacillus sp. FSL H7-0756]|uniref:hypothetical protein n=2 Tax=unclassified Paenibacillus TaxID=185978 RepID=UPI0030FD8FC1